MWIPWPSARTTAASPCRDAPAPSRPGAWGSPRLAGGRVRRAQAARAGRHADQAQQRRVGHRPRRQAAHSDDVRGERARQRAHVAVARLPRGGHAVRPAVASCTRALLHGPSTAGKSTILAHETALQQAPAASLVSPVRATTTQQSKQHTQAGSRAAVSADGAFSNLERPQAHALNCILCDACASVLSLPQPRPKASQLPAQTLLRHSSQLSQVVVLLAD